MLKRRWLTVTILLLALAAASTVAAGGIEIRGKVLGSDGLPYPEARVSLVPVESAHRQAAGWLAGAGPEPETVAVTGRAGDFLLIAPAAGHWTVRVEAAGAVPQAHDLEPLVEPVLLAPVQLHPDAGLQVRVSGPDGTRSRGALVRLYDNDDPRMRLFREAGWRTPTFTALTGEEGACRLPRAEGDRRQLAVSMPGHPVVRRTTGFGTATTVRLAKGREVRLQVLEDREGQQLPVPDALVLDTETGQPLGATDGEGRLMVQAPGKSRMKWTAITADGRRAGGSGVVLVLSPLDAMVGRLIDSSDRVGISGGLVWPEGRPWDAVVADRTGGFVLQAPLGSRDRLVADATGYLQSGDTRVRFAGDGRPGPIIALAPAASLQGTVTDPGGNGVEGAEIGVSIRQSHGMMRIEIGGPPPPRTVTDDRGRFRISKVDPSNNYDVTATANGFVAGKLPVLDLKPGTVQTGIDITLDPGIRVSGAVVDEDGAPVEDARVTLRPSSGRRMGGMMILDGSAPEPVESWTGSDGRFTLTGVPFGSGEIRIHRPGFASFREDGLDLAATPRGLEVGPFTLSPGGAVQGLVLDTDGAPVAEAEIRVAEPGGGGMMMIMGGGSPPSDEGPDAVTGQDGWFTLEDQPTTGKLALNVSRTGFLRGGAAVAEVPNMEPVTITLEPSLTFSGVVLDGEGEPVPRADLNLTRSMTSGAGGMQMKMVMVEGRTADEEGRFEFDGLEPGKVSISGSAPGFQETKIDGIEMVKGQDLTGFELPLTPGAVLLGRVLAPDGEPAIDAVVAVVQDGGEERFESGPGSTKTDGGGNYRLENLPPGPVSIEATHNSYVRTVRDIEANEGINSLDLQFEGGQQVTGFISGPDGGPVPGASVRLQAAGRGWGGPQDDAGTDGSFVLEGVSDGQYTLTASAEGFAPPAEPVTVQVAGEPVSGITLQLQATAVITGTVSGLDPSDYPQVEINAFGDGQFGDSRVDSDGRYRIEGLGAGSYVVTGAVGRSGNQARAQAVLEPGQQEAVADLEFGQGVTLSGKVLRGDRPFHSATVEARGTDVSHTGWGETDADGSFRLSGLKPGNYQVRARQWKTGISHEEAVEVASSREIELRIPTATVAGTVTDSADRRPLAGVRVSLAPPDGSVETFFGDRSAVTDLNGRFTVGNIADGSWTLWATKKGYATVSRDIQLQMGTGPEDLRLELDPTDGLSLEVRFPTGAIPDSVRAAVLDPSGRTVNSGSYATGENGSVRLSSVPRGQWDVVLYAPGAGVLSFRADVPGGPVPVLLPRPTTLTVRVPELAGSGTRATLTLTDPSGTPFRSLEWYGDPVDRFPLQNGAWSSAVLPPGAWSVTVQAADGRSWQGSASTGGGPADLVLE